MALTERDIKKRQLFLRICPCCGGNPYLRYGQYTSTHSILCEDCDLTITLCVNDGESDSDILDELTRRWNSRISDGLDG